MKFISQSCQIIERYLKSKLILHMYEKNVCTLGQENLVTHANIWAFNDPGSKLQHPLQPPFFLDYALFYFHQITASYLFSFLTQEIQHHNGLRSRELGQAPILLCGPNSQAGVIISPAQTDGLTVLATGQRQYAKLVHYQPSYNTSHTQ